MRKSLISAIALVAGLSSLSMYRNPALDLLDERDYEQMRNDIAHGPALSAPLDRSPYWASYDQWHCFPTESIEISYVEAEYGEMRKLPTLHVTEGSHLYEFSMDPEPAPNFDNITNKWKALLQDEGTFCVYAAPLQELDVANNDTTAESASLWIIHQLKTTKGYWTFESEENWLKDDDDDLDI
jgi:hypothetical protein